MFDTTCNYLYIFVTINSNLMKKVAKKGRVLSPQD